jgi:hypothetical protein
MHLAKPTARSYYTRHRNCWAGRPNVDNGDEPIRQALA